MRDALNLSTEQAALSRGAANPSTSLSHFERVLGPLKVPNFQFQYLGLNSLYSTSEEPAKYILCAFFQAI